MKKQSEFPPLDFAKLKKKLCIQNSIKARLLPFPFFCEMNYRDENNMYNKGLPLKYVNFDVEIVESFSYINITQTYENNFSYKIETEFLFSMANDACFYNFSAEMDGFTIEGTIKEKIEAKKEYIENKAKGNTVALSEKLENIKDVIKVNIGQIPPGKEIKIKFSYLQMLDICLNKFWRLIIPGTLTPRYNSEPNVNNESKLLENIQYASGKNKYKWSINAKITSKSEISFIKSSSHEIQIKYLDLNKTVCELSFGEGNFEAPNKDFCLLFKNEEIHKPKWTLYKKEDDEYPYCGMLTFFPQFNKDSNDDAFEAFRKDSVKSNFRVNLNTAKGEYIFLLDRSGSMDGRRINMAKEALLVFLKSLPMNSYFNIVSFGSRYSFMFKDSKKNEKNTIDKAISDIKKFEADMNGTEICHPLNSLYKLEIKNDYPRNVFILTDGCISDNETFLKLVNNNNINTRTYTIGLGNGCSRELIIEGANAGKGKYEFIGDNEDLNSKIISLLEDSITPFINKIEIIYDKSLVELMTPLPETIAFLRKNEPFNLFVFFNQKLQKTNFQIKFDDDSNQTVTYNTEIAIDDLTIHNSNLHKYAFNLIINRMVRNLSYDKDVNSDIYFAKKQDIGDFCVSKAIQHQILTDFTAFICVVKQNEIIDYRPCYKIEIPQIMSVDNGRFIPKSKCLPASKHISNVMMRSECLSLALPSHPKAMTPIPIKEEKGKIEMEFKQFNLIRLKKKNKKSEIFENDSSDSQDNELFEKKIKLEKKISKSDKKIPESTIQKPTIQNNRNFIEIIQLQEISGYWNANKEISKLLGIDLSDIVKNIPEDILKLNNKNEIWITFIILYFLETKFANIKGSWSLVSRKAEDYLDEFNFKLPQFKEICLKLIEK